MSYALGKWIKENCQFVVACVGTENEAWCLTRFWPMMEASSGKLERMKNVAFWV